MATSKSPLPSQLANGETLTLGTRFGGRLAAQTV